MTGRRFPEPWIVEHIEGGSRLSMLMGNRSRMSIRVSSGMAECQDARGA